MASTNSKNGVTAGTMTGEDGWSYFYRMHGDYVGKLLGMYQANITGWKVEEKEKGTMLVAKIQFEGEPKPSNVNYWTWLIGVALFPGFGKVFVTTGVVDGKHTGYASVTFWRDVNYRESSRSNAEF